MKSGAGLVVATILIAACAGGPELPETGTAITGATIYAAPDADPMVGGTILVSGGRIVDVGPAKSVRIPKSYEQVDAAGQFAVAGYWNSHTHLVGEHMTDPLGASDKALAAYFTDAYLKYGFTTILDLASETSIAIAVSEHLRATCALLKPGIFRAVL